jgi:hypothetical protein|tara:strand:- start:373 stop:501 length:129 start_codon:yes stop_codon:yes gene_type:complete
VGYFWAVSLVEGVEALVAEALVAVLAEAVVDFQVAVQVGAGK